MGNSSSSDPGSLDEPAEMNKLVNNHMVLQHMVQYLEIRDLLTLRQVNAGCDYFIRHRMHQVGAPAKEMKSDAEIDKFTVDMANGPRPVPFSSFVLDVTRMSMEGINKFLEHRDAILELSIVHVPDNPGFRQIYLQHNVGPKLGRIMTTLSRSLRTLRLKFFGDVTLVGDDELALYPPQLEALTTLEGVYTQPNHELEGDLVDHLTQRAGNLDHLVIRQHDPRVNFVPDLLERVPNLLFGRDRPYSPSLTLDTNVRVQDYRTFQDFYDRGYDRLRRLNLGLFSYHLCQKAAPVMYGNLLQSLTNLLSLQGESLEELLLVTSHCDGVQEGGSDYQIQLPPVMSKLTRLALYFPRKEATVLSPVAPFVEGQLPKLEHVDLGYDHGWFRDLVIPTVASLQLNFEEEMTDHHVVFPGLKALLFYAQNPPTVLADMMRREGGEVEVLGCFGLASRITRPPYLSALIQRVKLMVGDIRVPEEHLLGHFYGMTRFDVSRLDQSLTSWQRGIISLGPKAEQIPNWPQLKQFHLSVFGEDELAEVEHLYENGDLPMFQEFGVWVFPTDVTQRQLTAANLGPYNEITFSINLDLQ